MNAGTAVIAALVFVACLTQVTPVQAASRRPYMRPLQGNYPLFVARYPSPTLELSVPYHRQERRLSCEAATLRMALLAKGIDVPEGELQGKMPILSMDSDPQHGFIGDVDGVQHVSGYGIHWDGIAEIGKQYRPSWAFSGVDLHFLIDRLHDGSPVIVWGSVYRRPADRSWTTHHGVFVHAVQGEHTWVVTGYIGDRRSPTHLITLDPIYGKRVFPTQSFLNNWSHFGNSGVVVE